MSDDIVVRLAHWPEDMADIRAVRTVVFIDEQQVTEEEEWDGLDDQCVHVLARTRDGQAIGTGRLLPDGKIGRMAVLADYRGRDVGSRLLQELMAIAAERGFTEVRLASQVHAIPFYGKHGFSAYGEEFMDAGIPHRWMKAALKEAAES